MAPTNPLPEIEQFGCLGEIIWHEKLSDGRYNLRLRGLSRIRIVEEVPTGKLYRSAQVELLSDIAPTNLAELSRLRRNLAETVLPRFADNSPAQQQLQELFDGDMPLGQVCDADRATFPVS